MHRMCYMLELYSVLLEPLKSNKLQQLRPFYKIQHNEKRGFFSVKLQEDSRAVLHYKADGKILDVKSINVPKEYTGQGIARLLAEAVFTYAIVNSYYLYLTCKYLQKYYLAVKNDDLEEYVIGPPDILNGSYSTPSNLNLEYELPNPEDFMIFSSKKK